MSKYFINLLLSLIVFVILIPISKGQSKNEVIGRVGKTIISKEEFYKRYEFTPHIKSKTGETTDSTKLNFLYTLIGEKLLAESAKVQNMHKLHEYEIMMNYLRNIYLRDALYQSEVKNKIIIPSKDVSIGKKRITKLLKTRFIFSTDEEEIKRIYSNVKNGASFDSILATRPEIEEQKDTAEVTFGTMNEILENVIYELRPNQITAPVRLTEGWYICKVYSISSQIYSTEEIEKKVEKVISSRIEDKIYQDFYKKFFKGKNVNADAPLFVKLGEAIYTYCKENEKAIKTNNSNKIRLVEKDVEQFKKKITTDLLTSIFIKFEIDPISLAQFLDYFMLEGFEIDKVDKKHIESRLNSFVRNFIKNELLAREGLKRGLDKISSVSSELKMWSDFYLSRFMMKNIFTKESISDDEAYNFYTKSSQIISIPTKVKVAEILVKNLDTVHEVLNELDKGVSFKELALRHSIRDSIRMKGFEFDYFSVNENGDIGKAAMQMKVGEVFGPIKLTEGFSIIKLLDKKEAEKVKFDKFQDAKEEIKSIIKTEKMYKKLNDITSQLAIDQGIEINERMLKALKVTDINMLVFRRFGFGGQLVASPFSPDFSAWFKNYKQLKKKSAL